MSTLLQEHFMSILSLSRIGIQSLFYGHGKHELVFKHCTLRISQVFIISFAGQVLSSGYAVDFILI